MSRVSVPALLLATAALAVATRHLGPVHAPGALPVAGLFSFAISAFREPLR